MERRLLADELFPQQREQRGVLPFTVLQIRLPLDPLPHVAAGLCVRDRSLAEAVDLQLDAVEVEIDEQVPLERARSCNADPAAPEARVDGEPSRFGDAVPLVDGVNRDAAGTLSV